MENNTQGIKLIKEAVDVLPKEIRKSVYNKIRNVINYEPVIGIMGKTGAGKSSLCNSIFKGNVCAVSDVEACTRKVQELIISFGDRTIKIIDIPGVGENEAKDIEYEELYKNLLPELDLVLWVVKGDDRAFSADEHFYKNILKPVGGDEKVLFVLNQVDKIEPFREWDEEKHQPSPSQQINIRKKEEYLIERFGFTKHPVISVSANEGYNISRLVEAIVRSLPKEAQSGVVHQVKDEIKTKEIVETAKDGFADTVDRAIDDIIDTVLPKPIASVAKVAKKAIVSVAKSVWGLIFG
ncbi:GTPase family protein [Escherichia coli]|uniref:GTPase family protein n=1 Tax=Escherichia coli TaxID=562 RepID=UPI000BDE5962|nr:GTPase [Escherichia coli]EFG8165002.1 GTP-binding protein [Escherichia coli]EFU8347480.1 GTP-binding protein [Escherichia coli]EFU9589820.1 GTP-binding protein [Escherichia coli]EGB1109617.1 GTP-binding protein [Escherichia coli]EGF8517049.1 GTP-binding protein [Escherichia coli]